MAMGFADRAERSNLTKELRDSILLSQKTSPKRASVRASTPERNQSDASSSRNSERQSPKPVQRISPQTASSSCAIRARFLNRLGFSQDPAAQQPAKSASLTRDACSRANRLTKRISFSENLKGDYGTKDELIEIGSLSSISTASTAFTASSSSSRRSVSFDASVVVHPIARRTAYSNRIRSALWTSPEEMRNNAARNCYEFAAESWDWRKVANDEDMVLYNGEPVHPVHFVQDYTNLRQRFTP